MAIGVLRYKTRDALKEQGFTSDTAGMKAFLVEYILMKRIGTKAAGALLGCTQTNIMQWLQRLDLQNPRTRGGNNNKYGRKGKPYGGEARIHIS